MRTLLFLIIHPAHAIRSREPVPVLALLVLMGGYLLLCGISFSHLYPRLLNEVPWLGFFRKLHPGTWNPKIDAELFMRGAAMGFVVLASYCLIYTGLQLIRGKESNFHGLVCGFATSIPILLTCGIGYLFHFLNPSFGLAPVYGLLASTCLHAFFLRDLCRLHRGVVVYLAPAVAVAQLYACFILLP